MQITFERTPFFERFSQAKEYIAKPHVKIAALAASILATSLFVPLYFLPACSKLGQFVMVAGASTGWGIYFNFRHAAS